MPMSFAICHLSFVICHLSLNTSDYLPRLQFRANLNPMHMEFSFRVIKETLERTLGHARRSCPFWN
jgi:hypothetical protein